MKLFVSLAFLAAAVSSCSALLAFPGAEGTPAPHNSMNRPDSHSVKASELSPPAEEAAVFTLSQILMIQALEVSGMLSPSQTEFVRIAF